MGPGLLLIEALQLGVHVAPQLPRGQARRPIADEAERSVLRRHELREVALLRPQTARRGEVPAIFLPGGSGRPERLVVGLGDDDVDDEADHRRLALHRERTRALVLLPRGAITRHRRGEPVERADDDRVHAFHRRGDRVAHVPERRGRGLPPPPPPPPPLPPLPTTPPPEPLPAP